MSRDPDHTPAIAPDPDGWTRIHFDNGGALHLYAVSAAGTLAPGQALLAAGGEARPCTFAELIAQSQAEALAGQLTAALVHPADLAAFTRRLVAHLPQATVH